MMKDSLREKEAIYAVFVCLDTKQYKNIGIIIYLDKDIWLWSNGMNSCVKCTMVMMIQTVLLKYLISLI